MTQRSVTQNSDRISSEHPTKIDVEIILTLKVFYILGFVVPTFVPTSYANGRTQI